MSRMIRILAVVSVCVLVGASALLAQGAAQAPVKANPSAVTKGKAGAPPPANATKGASVGKGKASASTANAAGDTDSVWAEKIDIDGDGNVDDVQVLWDDEDKVLYYSKTGTFTCSSGGTGSGGMLVAVFAAGNSYGKPANSGWWVAEVDKDECKADAAGLVGCKFDGTGANTACGVAIIDNKTDDITFVAVRK
jgi:hypothetical protein